ncbi:antibiotic biosynthesis monooxygenase [uncultured Cohaesibacter sp.]|uniref:antibiotic biosynthesis monooxygenase family protein n=1 Tax=uncultured Cohaesibacter sp. TaxID=1002546 RepID=UPI0029C76249|nr:antibiotic biosynthesis monooxygenase [uncultured Cohaesibacter sp.]
MYLVMNRFRVKVGFEAEFEAIWRERESKLLERDGFVSFDLLKGEEKEGYVLFASHALWRDREAFLGWTKSAQFRSSHGKPKNKHTVEYAGPPVLECFDVIEDLSIKAEG